MILVNRVIPILLQLENRVISIFLQLAFRVTLRRTLVRIGQVAEIITPASRAATFPSDPKGTFGDVGNASATSWPTVQTVSFTLRLFYSLRVIYFS